MKNTCLMTLVASNVQDYKVESTVIKSKTENNCYICIKTRWILIVWSVEKILKILTQKCLEQKIID